MSINEYIAGAIGGIAGIVVGYPFDTTKIQMQIRTTGDHKLDKTSDAFTSVAAQGMKKGLFRGMLFPTLSYGFVNSLFFGVYGNTIRLLEPDHTAKPSNLQVYVAGCVAGTAQLSIACPVEVVKCTMQAQIPLTVPKHEGGSLFAQEGHIKPRTYYEGPMDCVRAIYKYEGIPGFYKGMFAMFIRDVPSYGLYLLVYESLHKYMINNGLSDRKGVVAAIVAGGLAGSASWAAIMPLDVVKSRLQTETSGFEPAVDHGGRYKGFWDCLIKSVRRGGVNVLFTGTVITILRAFPVNAVTFLVYSQLLNYLRIWNPPSDRPSQE